MRENEGTEKEGDKQQTARCEAEMMVLQGHQDPCYQNNFNILILFGLFNVIPYALSNRVSE